MMFFEKIHQLNGMIVHCHVSLPVGIGSMAGRWHPVSDLKLCLLVKPRPSKKVELHLNGVAILKTIRDAFQTYMFHLDSPSFNAV